MLQTTNKMIYFYFQALCLLVILADMLVYALYMSPVGLDFLPFRIAPYIRVVLFVLNIRYWLTDLHFLFYLKWIYCSSYLLIDLLLGFLHSPCIGVIEAQACLTNKSFLQEKLSIYLISGPVSSITKFHDSLTLLLNLMSGSYEKPPSSWLECLTHT